MIPIVLNIVFISVIFFALWKWKANQLITKEGYITAILLKIFFAIYCVFHYENGDIEMFISDSRILSYFFWINNDLYWDVFLFDDYSVYDCRGWFYYWNKPRAFFIGKTLSIFNLLTFGNKYLNSIYFSVINFLTIFILISKAKYHNLNISKVLILILLFIPSVVFNTSGLEKEVLVMAGVYLVLSFGISIYFKKTSLYDLVLFLVGMFLIYKIKYYYIAVICPLGIAFLMTHFINNKYFKYVLATFVILFLLFYSKLIHPYLDPFLAFQSTIEANHSLILRSGVGMNIPYNFTDYTLIEFLYNLPLAIIYGLFGPFFWEFKNITMFYIGLENLLILTLTFWFVINVFIGKIKWTYFGTTVLIYVISLATILAFYSPNFGTLTRYKVIFIPFMLIFIFQNTLGDRITKLPFLKFIFK